MDENKSRVVFGIFDRTAVSVVEDILRVMIAYTLQYP